MDMDTEKIFEKWQRFSRFHKNYEPIVPSFWDQRRVANVELGSLGGGNGRLRKTQHRQHKQFKEKPGPGGTLSSDGETMNREHGLRVYFVGVG